VSFADLPRTAPNAYASWLFLTRYAGFADIFGIDSPLMLVPPIDRLMPELAPSGNVSWSDDAGWHCRGVTPFPGADALAQDPLGTMMAAQPALMASILLPSLNRARETANRVKAQNNLRQIGVAMLLYSNEHRGQYPASLGELAAATEELTPEVFVSPSSNTAVPGQVLDRRKLGEWVNENSDFVYMGSGKTNAAGPEEILAYEKPDIHGGDGFNILFGDGHVEFVGRDYGMKLVNEQEAKDRRAK
jgi:prepilin-type processing-associated H-X9-DG protein